MSDVLSLLAMLLISVRTPGETRPNHFFQGGDMIYHVLVSLSF